MFDIDLVRFVLENKINDEKIPFFSFYEPIQNVEQLTRYKENLQYIIGEQNGMNDNNAFAILTSNSMEITNLKSNYISSFSIELNIRTYAKFRDKMVNKFKKVINKEINGRKFDLVVDENDIEYFYDELDLENLQLNKFIGYKKDFGIYSHEYLLSNIDTISDEFNLYLSDLYGVEDISIWKPYILVHEKYLYKFDTILTYIGECDLYKVDFNFTGFECDAPSTINADDIINITCTGNCTVCDSNVKLGNDLSKFTINGIECEPLGLDSAYQSGNVGSQLNYVENKYIVSTSNAFSYSFVVNEDNSIINELYKIARYDFDNPNLIYTITEEFSSYGITTSTTYKAKIMKSTCNSNVGDIMQITIDFLRGDY